MRACAARGRWQLLTTPAPAQCVKLERVRGTGTAVEISEEFRHLTLQVIGESILSLSPEESDRVFPHLYLPIMARRPRRALRATRAARLTRARAPAGGEQPAHAGAVAHLPAHARLVPPAPPRARPEQVHYWCARTRASRARVRAAAGSALTQRARTGMIQSRWQRRQEGEKPVRAPGAHRHAPRR